MGVCLSVSNSSAKKLSRRKHSDSTSLQPMDKTQLSDRRGAFIPFERQSVLSVDGKASNQKDDDCTVSCTVSGNSEETEQHFFTASLASCLMDDQREESTNSSSTSSVELPSKRQRIEAFESNKFSDDAANLTNPTPNSSSSSLFDDGNVRDTSEDGLWWEYSLFSPETSGAPISNFSDSEGFQPSIDKRGCFEPNMKTESNFLSWCHASPIESERHSVLCMKEHAIESNSSLSSSAGSASISGKSDRWNSATILMCSVSNYCSSIVGNYSLDKEFKRSFKACCNQLKNYNARRCE